MKHRIVSLTLLTSLVLAGSQAEPASAQYSPYSYLYMGQSLLYPLSRGLALPFMYGTYNANPFFSMNSYMRTGNSFPNVFPFTNASYGPWGYRNAGMMPGYFNTNNNNNNQAQPRAQDEPDNNNPGANTMNSTNPYQPPPPAYTTPPAAVPSSGGAPAVQPGYSYMQPASAVHPTSMPPSGAASAAASHPTAAAPVINAASPAAMASPQSATAPGPVTFSPSSAHAGGGSPASPMSAPSSVASVTPPAVSVASPAAALPAVATPPQALGRPLAEGFINHLNTNYQGDMSKALGNQDTRSWARAMGIIGDDVPDGSHLSKDRLEVIDKLLKDNSLDPVSKLDTMRILLKKNPASAI
jgi:hypothetical protein